MVSISAAARSGSLTVMLTCSMRGTAMILSPFEGADRPDMAIRTTSS
jgi:hypothetical protein